jgi:hypothetical protein
MKIFVSSLVLLFLVGCSGHIYPPAVKFGKKCSISNDGQVTYSYVWFHKQDEELKASKEACKEIAD